jgi:protein HIRA/HIR1
MVAWSHSFTEKVVAVAASNDVIAIAGAHGGVHVLSCAGDRLLPPLVAGGLIALLRVKGAAVTIITSFGKLFSWDISSQTAVHSGIDIGPVAADPRNADVLDVDINADGRVTLLVAPRRRAARHLAPARAYTYHSGLGCWIELGDADSDVYKLSDFHNGVDPATLKAPTGALAKIQAPLRAGIPGAQLARAAALRKLDVQVQVTATQSYIQGQLAAAAALQSADEYRYWLRCYVQVLARHSREADLRSVFNAMLEGNRFGGPPRGAPAGGAVAAAGAAVTATEVDVTLLKELLVAVGEKNRELQRFVAEYTEVLAALSSA